VKGLIIVTLLTLTYQVWSETESQRFLRLSCEKSNNGKACVLLGKIILEEKPDQADLYFKRGCKLGRCVEGYKKTVAQAKKESKPVLKEKSIGKGFQVKVNRSVASDITERCVDLMRALSQCRSYRCKLNHPLISEHMVIHHILKQKDICEYTLELPHNKKITCLLSEDQVREFESFSQLEAFAHLDDLISSKDCQFKEID
jgi:hypothetical protein